MNKRPTPDGETHAVENVASDLDNYNLYASDQALVDAVQRHGGEAGQGALLDFGARLGTADMLRDAHLANAYPPKLETHDRFGKRIDLIEYHEAYHRLMRTSMAAGLHGAPWEKPGRGAHVVRGAMTSMMAQVEAGHGCPITMTFASIPSLRCQPQLAERFEAKVLNRAYDPSNRPIADKASITIGMGMTEKQGGSDVRANSTLAELVSGESEGLYALTGHKWFLSAPMCDLFLVLAQTDGGLSCFAVPRWRDDGSKNPLHIIRLKDKMGNRSNASSEVELRGAHGWLVGEPGRGVATIIEMVSLTRFDCMGGSAGNMRAGLANAIHHCTQRSAFGAPLIQQPLMRNVLADLALEYEGAIAFHARMAAALDAREQSDDDRELARLCTALGKYWVCKRAPRHAYEVMECIGGSGVMENSMFPRLYREAVINPIWEGSGNVQCLDVLRAMRRQPGVVDAYFGALSLAAGGHAGFDQGVTALKQTLAALTSADPASQQFAARRLVEQMAVLFQASLLIQHAPLAIADAWCANRLGGTGMSQYGTLQDTAAVELLLRRADPSHVASVQTAAAAA